MSDQDLWWAVAKLRFLKIGQALGGGQGRKQKAELCALALWQG